MPEDIQGQILNKQLSETKNLREDPPLLNRITRWTTREGDIP